MENKFDKEIQELFKAYEEQPSANCWDKVSSQLDAMQNIPDAGQSSAASSSANGSAFSQFAGSIIGKVTIAVTSVAAIAGLSYLIATSDSSDSSQTITDTTSQVEVLTEEKDNKEDNTIIAIVEQPETPNKAQKQVIAENNPISQENRQIEKEESENISSSSTISEDYSVAQNQPEIAQEVKPKEIEEQEIAKEQEITKPNQDKKETLKRQKNVKEEADLNTEIPKEESANEKTPTIDVSKIPISNLLTPNGENCFTIGNIDQYPENKLIIFARDGRVFYEKINYRNNWKGDNIPDGVYYYMFTFIHQGETFMRNGSITIKR